jgi:DNA polymerase V
MLKERLHKEATPYMNVPVTANQPQWLPFNLNHELIKHPVATFFVRVSGDSMINAGIFPGDILMIDKAIEARHNHIVIAILNGEYTVKRLKVVDGKVFLWPENASYQPIEITETMEFQVWGVVTYAIHKITGYIAE